MLEYLSLLQHDASAHPHNGTSISACPCASTGHSKDSSAASLRQTPRVRPTITSCMRLSFRFSVRNASFVRCSFCALRIGLARLKAALSGLYLRSCSVIAQDFGDGGAYPEIHVAQFPRGMGKKKVCCRPGSCNFVPCASVVCT